MSANGLCHTPCPFAVTFPDEIDPILVKVGSMGCERCRHFRQKANGYVRCRE